MQPTYYWVHDPELGQLQGTAYCDGTCGYPCDGHEAPGNQPRCRSCYWKPCRCPDMERTQEQKERIYEEDLG